MTEASLTSALRAAIRSLMPSAVVFKHCDAVTAGIPDLSVTAYGMTMWLEVKRLAPTAKFQERQKLTCQRLDAQGACWYVLYKARGPRAEVHSTTVVSASAINLHLEDETVGRTFEGAAHYDVAATVLRHLVRER